MGRKKDNHPSDTLTRGDKIRLTLIGARLRTWFAEHGRDFPWRAPGATNYERICVEVLLQRTRANAVGGIYVEFFERFPSWVALANATTDELEELLKPLGLWRRRAVSLRGLARAAVEFNCRFPTSREELDQVPAAGQYVVNAIRLFEHGKREPLLDVNMVRILERCIRPRTRADIRHDPWLQGASRWLVRRGDAIATNWAVLDLGAIHCTASSPDCPACPLRSSCATGRTRGSPVHSKLQ